MERLCLLTLFLAPANAFVLPPTRSLATLPARDSVNRQASPRMYSSIDAEAVAARTARVLAAKEASGLSFDELATQLALTNTYTVQLLLGQAQLKPDTAPKLKAALPKISSTDLVAMQKHFPMRSFDEAILKEPNVYRTYEAITHYGEAIKALINEQCGDGIMSAIDFYMDVGTTTGTQGEKRVVITFNGKFLPFIEQAAANNGVPSPRD